MEGPRRRRRPRALPRIHEEPIGRKAVTVGTKSTKTRRPPIFYGWWVVLACAVIIYYGGGVFFYGFGVFFNPIREEFGWSAATAALAFSLYRLEAGIGAPIVGFLVDRFGPRALILFGSVVVGLGFILLSRINSLPTFYAAFLFLSFGFSFSMGPVGSVAVINWFVRKRGKALGVLMVGAGLTGTLAPVLAWLIHTYQWRTTLVIVGVGTWLVCLPVAILVRHRPEKYGMLPDGDPAPTDSAQTGQDKSNSAEIEGVHWSQALKSLRGFWFLAIAGTLSGAAISSTILLLVPHLESVGVPREQAALAITFLTLISLVGRLGLGWLADYVDKRYLLAFAFIIQAVGLVILAFVTEFWMVFPFLIFFGPGYGGGIPVRSVLLAEYFGRRYFGTIQGLQQTVMAIGGIVGPVVTAWIFDIDGSYQRAWLLLAAVTLAATVLILFTRHPREAETWASGGSEKAQAPESPAKGS
ncbi:MAG: MFS transporter [Dehalococcoidia bacterium]|nr:MFS transporter [Dehalococcoidia bacterium]